VTINLNYDPRAGLTTGKLAYFGQFFCHPSVADWNVFFNGYRICSESAGWEKQPRSVDFSPQGQHRIKQEFHEPSVAITLRVMIT
jgi:hypothetical protein